MWPSVGRWSWPEASQEVVLGSERLTGEKYSVLTQLGISVAGFGKKKPREGALLIAFSKASRALFELNGLKT